MILIPVAAAVLSACCLICFSGCGKLNGWLAGWNEEFEGLIDQIQADNSSGTADPSASSPADGGGQEGRGPFWFVSEDVDGNEVSLSDFSDAKIVMVNYWEPWCGPCIREMPDLARLYKDYSKDGLVIIGVFSTRGSDADVRDIIDSAEITYPIVRCGGGLEKYSPYAVPTTYFIDANGNLLSPDPVVGLKNYSGWEAIVKLFLK